MAINRKTLLRAAQTIIKKSNRGTSTSVPLAVLQTLIDELDLVAASFYSNSDIALNPALTLRAQIGLSYTSYASFVLPHQSTAGRCVASRKVEVFQNVGLETDYRDTELIDKFGLHSMLAIPLEAVRERFDDSDRPSVLGVICAYPRAGADTQSLRRALEDLRSIIAEAYVQSIQADKLRFREQVTKKAIASADLNSFLFRVCKLLQEEWPYEAISVFVHDERADILRLGATTGLKIKIPKQEVFVGIAGATSSLAECFKSGQIVLHLHEADDDVDSTQLDYVGGITRAKLFIPMFEPSQDESNNRTIGVLRVTNKLLRHEGRVEVFSFAWEDIEFFTFVCDVVGVIASMFDRVTKSKDDFERSLHGVQNNLNGVLGSLDFLNALLNRSSELKKYAYLVPTAKAQLQALSWQVERFSGREKNGKSAMGKCHLLADVFAKLAPLLRPLALSFSTKIGALPELNSVLLGCPAAMADPAELIIVFRNLFENSIKYSNRNLPLTIHLTWEVKNDDLLIKYSDNGIGIGVGDKNRIFYEGFRSENAMRRCSTGAGLGLFQCREFLQQMGGDILLSNLNSPTEFLVKIPLWRD